MACSIFIASISITTAPASTASPTFTGTLTTTPGRGVVSPPVAALAANCCARGSSSTSSTCSVGVHRCTRAAALKRRACRCCAPSRAARCVPRRLTSCRLQQRAAIHARTRRPPVLELQLDLVGVRIGAQAHGHCGGQVRGEAVASAPRGSGRAARGCRREQRARAASTSAAGCKRRGLRTGRRPRRGRRCCAAPQEALHRAARARASARCCARPRSRWRRAPPPGAPRRPRASRPRRSPCRGASRRSPGRDRR